MQFDVKDALVSKGQGAVKTATFNIPKLNYQKAGTKEIKASINMFCLLLNSKSQGTALIVPWH